MTIKLGSIVTWADPNTRAVKFRGCMVIGVGEIHGVMHAKVSLGRFGYGNARLSDLVLEEHVEATSSK